MSSEEMTSEEMDKRIKQEKDAMLWLTESPQAEMLGSWPLGMVKVCAELMVGWKDKTGTKE